MTIISGVFTPSAVAGDSSRSAVTFGADISREPVFLSVDVIPSHAFARLMLALGRVVRLQDTGRDRDHSGYQEWVRGQYLLELPSQMAGSLIRIPTLIAKREKLMMRVDKIRELRNRFLQSDPLWTERRAFWSWLYTHNREAWIVLDPIVSVQPDATFFEAFSQDESLYARVTLPKEATRSSADPVLGTTNIDFSVPLERELSRTRSYRPLHLEVGSNSVSVDTGVSSTVERKIDLPETWVRGLVEVQAALALAPVSVGIRSSVLADILARLDSEREKSGPRSLLFDLAPGQPVKITIEPWGETFIASREPYAGDEARSIKVWGRRRLRVLRELLPYVTDVTVRLIDSGMPSFWSVQIEGIDLTIGLSGWTSQDWAGRARFSALVPASAADDGLVGRASELLAQRQSLNSDDLSISLNIPPGDARLLLQRLCIAGLAMFDPTTGRYRYRALFPEIDLSADTGPGREERFGVELFRSGSVTVDTDTFLEDDRLLEASVVSNDRTNIVAIRRDDDGRVIYAQCDCSHFRHHKLRQGPCRHIIATSLAGG